MTAQRVKQLVENPDLRFEVNGRVFQAVHTAISTDPEDANFENVMTINASSQMRGFHVSEAVIDEDYAAIKAPIIGTWTTNHGGSWKFYFEEKFYQAVRGERLPIDTAFPIASEDFRSAIPSSRIVSFQIKEVTGLQAQKFIQLTFPGAIHIPVWHEERKEKPAGI